MLDLPLLATAALNVSGRHQKTNTVCCTAAKEQEAEAKPQPSPIKGTLQQVQVK